MIRYNLWTVGQGGAGIVGDNNVFYMSIKIKGWLPFILQNANVLFN